ncbi:Phage tail protein [Leclercia adecarboxylata]|uniref:phage head spike fiber domain-containing protein n=1 Tax=Leclercia adecarboxylata TaxID=83655 RepID=UPI003B27886F
MATLDDDLAKAVTEGFRLAQTSIINQDLILSGTGDVTVTLADESKKTGPSWSKLIAQAGAAGASAAAAKTSEANALASKNAAALSATNAATSEDNALASKNAAKTSETNAKSSENNAKTSENNAAASASSAAASLAAAQLLTSVPYEAAPFPDVWLPMNDDMRLLAGVAPYDRLTISGQILELPTKSATFARSTIATYIDKSGVLQTAAINEPRFEREGLLMESQSTNYFLNSDDPTRWAGKAASLTATLITDGATNAPTFKGVCNSTAVSNLLAIQSGAISVAAGEGLTLSARFKGDYGKFKFRVVKDSTFFGDASFDFSTGIQGGAGNTTGDMIATSKQGSDGYTYATLTLTNAVAGAYVGQIYIMPADKDSNVPVGTEFYVQTVQVEKSAVPTSYIPTGSSAVTRSADAWSLTAENAGYKTLASKFKRTLAFEFVAKGVGPSASSYVDVVRVSGVTNDIICRLSSSNRLTSYRDGGGIFVPYTADVPGIFVHQIDGDKYTSNFNGSTSTRTGAPANNTATVANMSNSTGPAGTAFVYHIRNLRIWHRLLTPNQINGLR